MQRPPRRHLLTRNGTEVFRQWEAQVRKSEHEGERLFTVENGDRFVAALEGVGVYEESADGLENPFSLPVGKKAETSSGSDLHGCLLVLLGWDGCKRLVEKRLKGLRRFLRVCSIVTQTRLKLLKRITLKLQLPASCVKPKDVHATACATGVDNDGKLIVGERGEAGGWHSYHYQADQEDWNSH
jgi:hypothetical protein